MIWLDHSSSGIENQYEEVKCLEQKYYLVGIGNSPGDAR